MKSLYYRIIDLKFDGVYSYNINLDHWEKGYKSASGYIVKDYFVAIAIMKELKKRYPENDIYVDSFQNDRLF